jgi:predicted nuclease with TOPRIM domain
MIVGVTHSLQPIEEISSKVKRELSDFKSKLEQRQDEIAGLKMRVKELRGDVETRYVTELTQLHSIRDQHVCV